MGVENGYFDLYRSSGGRVSYEKRLAEHEHKAHGLLPLISNECFFFDSQRREIMAMYIGLINARTRARKEAEAWLATSTSDVVRQLTEDRQFLEECASLWRLKLDCEITTEDVIASIMRVSETTTSPKATRRTFIENIFGFATMVKDSLLEKPWQIWKARGGEFLTTDNPVGMVMPIKDAFVPGFGLTKPGVLVLFPVAPDACLVAGRHGSDYRDVDDTVVAEVNRALICSLSQEAYSRNRQDEIQVQVDSFGGTSLFGRTAFVLPGFDHKAKAKEIIKAYLSSGPRQNK